MTYLQKKKLAFMSIVNQIKGFVRTVTGVSPLTLPECVGIGSVINYSITGNGVGDYDENTGKYKIPVVCSGINLFNPEEVIAKFDSGDTYNSGSYTCTSIQLKPNTKYYMKTFNPTGETGYFYMGKYEVPNKSPSSTICLNIDINQYKRGYEEAVTTDETGCLYLGSVFISANERRRILRENQIQIVEGEYTALTVPEYETYQKPVTTNIYLNKPLEKGQTINYKNDKLPALPAMQGTTIYTVDASIEPENVEVTYYGTSKE